MSENGISEFEKDFGLDSDQPQLSAIEAELQRLAALPLVEYAQVRKERAKALSLTAGWLDLLMKERRPNGAAKLNGQGEAVDLKEPTPWPQRVEGITMLGDLVAFFDRYAKLPERGALILALWAIHTHCYTLWRYTPRLFITGPTKRCGKTRTLDLIGMVACKPMATSSISAAAVYRIIEASHPTLLIDEMDQLSDEDKQEMTLVLNTGFQRGGKAIRAIPIGDVYEARCFDTFAPCAMAGIGKLHGTLEDRSLRLPMQRALADERRPKLTAEVEALGVDLARRIARWVQDHYAALAAARPDVSSLPDRVDDCWTPLLAIAEVAGGDWPAEGMAAAHNAAPDEDAQSLGEQLLADIRAVLGELEEEIPSDALIERLVALEGRPWAELGKPPKPITKNKLAKLLKPFKVKPTDIWAEVWERDQRVKKCLRGYKRQPLDKAFERYLPAPAER